MKNYVECNAPIELKPFLIKKIQIFYYEVISYESVKMILRYKKCLRLHLKCHK